MNIKNVLLFVAAIVAVSGCAPLDPRERFTRPQKDKCENNSHCDIKVTVTCNDIKPSDPCWLTVDIDLMVLVKRGNNDKLTWSLSAPGNDFRFAANAIVFDDPAAWRCPGNEPRQRQCFALRDGFQVYKYDIFVESTAGRTVKPYDPWVVVN